MRLDFTRIAVVDRGGAVTRFLTGVAEYNAQYGTGIRTVAFFTDRDRGATFVRAADESVCLGPPTYFDERDALRKPAFLDYDRLEDAIQATAADAVWVGWGFPGGMAELAERCRELGVLLIGPSPESQRRLADTESLRRLAGDAGVPFATAGSGDFMRLDVQVVSDRGGNVAVVGVRNASVQRAGRPVLTESAPCGQQLQDLTLRLAETAGLDGLASFTFAWKPSAQTVQLLDADTRLQPEHVVTEMTTGLDLVKLQLHVSRGGRLETGVPQAGGHALAVRIHAEDSERGFAAATGVITEMRLPSGPGVRVDRASRAGDEIVAESGTAIAMVAVWGRNRDEARARLERALREARIVVDGGTTTKAFLVGLLRQREIVEANADTGWLDRLVKTGEHVSAEYAAIALLQAAADAYEIEHAVERDNFFASAARGHPDVSAEVGKTVEFRHRGAAYRFVVFRLGARTYRVDTGKGRVDFVVERADAIEGRLTCLDRTYQVESVVQGAHIRVEVEGVAHAIARDAAGVVRAPGPGMVVSVAVRPGDEVAAGDPLAVIESMKMETTILAPFGGRIRTVSVIDNVQVMPGAPLVQVEPVELESGGDGGDVVGFASLATPDASEVGLARTFDQLRWQLFGYDVDPADARRIAAGREALCARLPDDDSEMLRHEDDLLGIFADIAVLSRRQTDPDLLDSGQAGSEQEYLFSFLRSLDRNWDVPDWFVARLSRALAHYGVESLDRTPEFDEALFWTYKAHLQVQQQLPLVTAILDRRLSCRHSLAGRVGDDFRTLLDRLTNLSEGRYPALSDLARDVRFHYYDEPMMEAARQRVYDEMEARLADLERDPGSPERDVWMRALIDCPQPMHGVLMHWISRSAPEMQQAVLEALTLRYYRIRDLSDLGGGSIDGRPTVIADYEHDGPVHLVATYADFADLQRAVGQIRGHLDTVSSRDLVVEFFVMRGDPGAADDAVDRDVRALLEATLLDLAPRRVSVSVTNADGSTQFFTYRPGDGGFVWGRAYRGIHHMLFKRLHLDRLANFAVTRLPSVEDVYMFHGVAHDNPKDERLFAFAEVRDLTPVRDENGPIAALPYWERMFMECLSAIRQVQAHRPPEKRLLWNRVILYVWPPWTVRDDEGANVFLRVAPGTRGVGLEQVVCHVNVPDAATGDLREMALHMSNPYRQGVEIRWTEVADRPIRTLAPYRQKVLLMQRRGAEYPYEVVKMLTPETGADSPFPRGDFVEWDLDADDRLVPVERPYGENSANLVVGVIRNFTSKCPEGMARVVLLGDPSRSLGALAEPECRRINAALDLAEEMGVPLEWFALSSGARISMQSGTESMDWIGAALRRLIEFTQADGELNIVVTGINVGAQPYWNAEATMLMHTRGILVMTPDSAMVLTGKRSLDYSGGVSADDNFGIGGYDRIMGPNGQAQYWAPDLPSACRLLFRHYDHTYRVPGERFPRRSPTSDPADRDVSSFPHARTEGSDFTVVGDIFSPEKNPERKKPFDIRSVMRAVSDQDHVPLERWTDWFDAEVSVVWDAHVGGIPVCMVGFESHPLPRRGVVPADGPLVWTSGTLFPQSSKKTARAVNAASGNRPLVVVANLAGFDGSPESMRNVQLEYGAEIGRAITNFKGPIVFAVVSRYHGGAFVVFSKTLNESMEIAAVEGSYASVIGGAPAAAVVFSREVDNRTKKDPAIVELEEQIAAAPDGRKAALRGRLAELTRRLRSEKLREVADEYDHIHSIHRALEVGSVDRIIPGAVLRPYIVDALERGMAREPTR